MMESMLMVQQK